MIIPGHVCLQRVEAHGFHALHAVAPVCTRNSEVVELPGDDLEGHGVAHEGILLDGETWGDRDGVGMQE